HQARPFVTLSRGIKGCECSAGSLLVGTHRGGRLILYRSACKCASTNHSHLSMPRDTSVNKSAVSRSFSSLAWSMALRADLPNAARAEDSASTWLRPSTALAGYSASELR